MVAYADAAAEAVYADGVVCAADWNTDEEVAGYAGPAAAADLSASEPCVSWLRYSDWAALSVPTPIGTGLWNQG